MDGATGAPLAGKVRVHRPDPRHPLRLSDLLRSEAETSEKALPAPFGIATVQVQRGRAESLLVIARGYAPVRVDLDDLTPHQGLTTIHLKPVESAPVEP